MKTRKSKILFMLLVALCAFALMGCAKEHNKSDVKKYVKDMKIGKCNISDPKENEKGEKVWTVTQVSTGIEFQVTDKVYVGGMLGDEKYTLFNDFSAKMTEYYQDKLSAYQEIRYEDEVIVLEYSSLEELEAGCRDLIELYDFYFEQYDDYRISTNFLYRGEFADKIEYHYSKDSNNSAASRTQMVKMIYSNYIKDGFDVLYGMVKEHYLYMSIAHGLDSVYSEFTKEEIDEFVNSDAYGLNRMVTYPEEGKGVVSPELVTMYTDVYYGGLYRYLVEQGVEVDGTILDFTVVGQDGKTYEFSYDFYDEETGATYYTVDGEKVFYNLSFFDLNTNQIEEIFNLKLKLYDNDTVDKKKSEGELE